MTRFLTSSLIPSLVLAASLAVTASSDAQLFGWRRPCVNCVRPSVRVADAQVVQFFDTLTFRPVNQYVTLAPDGTAQRLERAVRAVEGLQQPAAQQSPQEVEVSEADWQAFQQWQNRQRQPGGPGVQDPAQQPAGALDVESGEFTPGPGWDPDLPTPKPPKMPDPVDPATADIPTVAASCLKCHGAGEPKKGLDLSRPITPLQYGLAMMHVGAGTMPPATTGVKLSKAQKRAISRELAAAILRPDLAGTLSKGVKP